MTRSWTHRLLLVAAVSFHGGAIGATAAQSAQPQPGQVVVDSDHPQWLKRHEGKHLFLCGPGDPEDFLYRGRRNADGTRDGDQERLIRKLIEHGGNSIYLQIVRTHGGDAKGDRTQNPFIDSDPAQRLDERILKQWEEWFTLMDQHDILIYLFFYDDGARIWNTGDDVGPSEQAFIEGIVQHFKHHKNLIWVVGEESEERHSTDRIQAIAATIRRADDRGHLVGNHHLSGATFKAWQPSGALNHFSMQLTATGERAHAGAIEALAKAGGRYQVIYAESTASPTDPDGQRRHAWEVAMAGMMPLLLGMDIASTPVESLQQCRYLQTFFEASDFYRMRSHDELRHGETKYVLADPGRSYIAYAEHLERELGITNLPAGRCDILWLDCQTGRTVPERQVLDQAANHVFHKPAGLGLQCAAWVYFPDVKPVATMPNIVAAPAIAGAKKNQAPVVTGEQRTVISGNKLYVQLKFADDDGPGPYSYTIIQGPAHGVLSGNNSDRFYVPQAGFVGRDEFTWKVNDGQSDSPIATVQLTVVASDPAVANQRRPSEASDDYFPPPESQGGWRKLDQPDQVRSIAGIDPEKLAGLKEWLLASDNRNFAAVVIKNGYIVLDVERGNSSKTDARRVASVSKAVCATVLAIAAEQSQQGLTPRKMKFNDPAFDFIPWAQPRSDPRKAKITVAQLLNHTSGICPEATGAKNDGTWDYVLGHSGDPLTAKLAFDPGTACGYSSHALHHASLVCENVTGKPYDEFAIEALFKPIGCEHWWFQYYEGGERYRRHPSHGIGMPARDLARIGYCLLRGGQWREKQVVPTWFVRETAAPTHGVKTPELRFKRDAQSFSHGWELPALLFGMGQQSGEGIPRDARYKPGSGGQLVAFVPSLDLVITRQTGGSGAWKYEEYLRRACQAVIPTKGPG